MSIFLLIFPCLAILCAPALWFVLGRPRGPRKATGEIAGATNISIVIPARNEEENIRKLLTSLQKQSAKPLEVIVVDDDSTDHTAEVSRALGATLIESGPLPDGWKGKPRACHQGARHAKGSWLLFLDADTVLDEDALATLHELSQHDARVYSLCPYHTIERPYEEFSAFFNVLMLAGSNAFSPKAEGNPTLFGQCLFLTKEHYEQVGTHAAVRDQVLENVHLSKEFQRLEIPCTSFLGKGVIHMRMFPDGMAQLCASWQKGFTNGAAQAHPRALLFSAIWLSGLMFSITSLALLSTPFADTNYAFATGAAYLLGVIQCRYTFRLAGNFSSLNALFFPLTLLFYQCLFFTSLLKQKRGVKTVWKGRPLD